MSAIRDFISSLFSTKIEKEETGELREKLKESLKQERVTASKQRRTAKETEKQLRNSILNEPDRLIGEILAMMPGKNNDFYGHKRHDDSH